MMSSIVTSSIYTNTKLESSGHDYYVNHFLKTMVVQNMTKLETNSFKQ
jgi:hypothetical protein